MMHKLTGVGRGRPWLGLAGNSSSFRALIHCDAGQVPQAPRRMVKAAIRGHSYYYYTIYRDNMNISFLFSGVDWGQTATRQAMIISDGAFE
jgi:hypothetical protein